jgi:hypothetical protein
MIHFLNITLQAKDTTCDWRAFLDFADSETMTVYQIRGYGSNPGEAANDAWKKYNSPDRDNHLQGEYPWTEEP